MEALHLPATLDSTKVGLASGEVGLTVGLGLGVSSGDVGTGAGGLWVEPGGRTVVV